MIINLCVSAFSCISVGYLFIHVGLSGSTMNNSQKCVALGTTTRKVFNIIKEFATFLFLIDQHIYFVLATFYGKLSILHVIHLKRRGFLKK